MAARPRFVMVSAALGAVTAWAWLLALALLALRWNSVERPLPPLRELFPYGEMRIGVDASYPPFAAALGDELSGLDIDLGRALGERLGVPVRFINMGFDGLYDSLKADQADMVISALLIDPSRTGEVLYTLPYYDAGLVLVSPLPDGPSQMNVLSGRSLAYEFGSEADLLTRRWLRRIAPFSTQPYQMQQHALDAVRLSQSDAALVDATTARLYRRQHPAWAVRLTPVSHNFYAIAVPITRGERWAAVNDALAALLWEGSVQRLIDQWL